MNHLVTEIPGVGQNTLKMLKPHKVNTVGDILNLSFDSIDGLDLNGLKGAATAFVTKQDKVFHEHSWFGKQAHVINNGKTYRCSLGNIIIRDGNVLIECKLSNGITKLRSPISVLAIHLLWTTNDIISEDEEECMYPMLDTLLGQLFLTGFTAKNEQPQLKLVFKEVRALYTKLVASETDA